ncbi:MAG TPA: hypothetical protein VFN95_17650, partial [Flavitalea sp.]|nr:hypothetical protein [Flavitalea sp.]
KDDNEQIVIQSVNPDQLYKKSDWQFRGSLGVIQLQKNNLAYLYLGSGRFISYQQYSMESTKPDGAAHLVINRNKLQLTCNQETVININTSGARSATLTMNGKSETLPVTKTASGIKFTVRTIENGEIEIK